MNIHSLRLAVLFATAFVPGVAVAQQAHLATAQLTAEMVQCARVQPVVNNIIAAAMSRLESDRQSNSPAEMRAAIDHLEGFLGDIRTQLAPCSAAAADPHAGMPGMQQLPSAPTAGQPPASVADPHAGHTMPAASGPPPQKKIDPVNGLAVDPANSPKTTYQGQTYYFSSEQTRKEFLEKPVKFTKNSKR